MLGFDGWIGLCNQYSLHCQPEKAERSAGIRMFLHVFWQKRPRCRFGLRQWFPAHPVAGFPGGPITLGNL